MSETTPEPAPGGLIERVEAWAAKKITPDIADVRAGTAKALAHLEALTPDVTALADVVVKLAGAVDPAAGPVVTEAVAEAQRIAASLKDLAGKIGGSD
jgi:hypothetical protein